MAPKCRFKTLSGDTNPAHGIISIGNGQTVIPSRAYSMYNRPRLPIIAPKSPQHGTWHTYVCTPRTTLYCKRVSWWRRHVLRHPGHFQRARNDCCLFYEYLRTYGFPTEGGWFIPTTSRPTTTVDMNINHCCRVCR